MTEKKKTSVNKAPAKKPKSSSTPKKSTARKTKVDWLEVKKEYLSDSTTSYRSLAKKYGVSFTTLEKRANREGWSELRQELVEKAEEAFKEKLLKTKSEANNRHLTHYQNIQAIANKSINEMANKNYLLDKAGNLYLDRRGNPVQRPINPFELEKLAKAMKEAINGERVVLGLPTSVSAITDTEGNDVWGKGLSEMVKAAERVIAENGSEASGGGSEA